MDDNLDLAVFFLSCCGLVAFISVEIGQYMQAQKKTYCAATLADGRQLTTKHLGPLGDRSCTYAPSYGGTKKHRGA